MINYNADDDDDNDDDGIHCTLKRTRATIVLLLLCNPNYIATI